MSADPTLFSDLGSYLRDASIDQVEEHADPDWMSSALVAARQVCTDHAEFTTDHIWERLANVEAPHEKRAVGAVMRRVKRNGWAIPTDRTRPSARPESHARPVRIWQSALT